MLKRKITTIVFLASMEIWSMNPAYSMDPFCDQILAAKILVGSRFKSYKNPKDVTGLIKEISELDTNNSYLSPSPMFRELLGLEKTDIAWTERSLDLVARIIINAPMDNTSMATMRENSWILEQPAYVNEHRLLLENRNNPEFVQAQKLKLLKIADRLRSSFRSSSPDRLSIYGRDLDFVKAMLKETVRNSSDRASILYPLYSRLDAALIKGDMKRADLLYSAVRMVSPKAADTINSYTSARFSRITMNSAAFKSLNVMDGSYSGLRSINGLNVQPINGITISENSVFLNQSRTLEVSRSPLINRRFADAHKYMAGGRRTGEMGAKEYIEIHSMSDEAKRISSYYAAASDMANDGVEIAQIKGPLGTVLNWATTLGGKIMEVVEKGTIGVSDMVFMKRDISYIENGHTPYGTKMKDVPAAEQSEYLKFAINRLQGQIEQIEGKIDEQDQAIEKQKEESSNLLSEVSKLNQKIEKTSDSADAKELKTKRDEMYSKWLSSKDKEDKIEQKKAAYESDKAAHEKRKARLEGKKKAADEKAEKEAKEAAEAEDLPQDGQNKVSFGHVDIQSCDVLGIFCPPAGPMVPRIPGNVDPPKDGSFVMCPSKADPVKIARAVCDVRFCDPASAEEFLKVKRPPAPIPLPPAHTPKGGTIDPVKGPSTYLAIDPITGRVVTRPLKPFVPVAPSKLPTGECRLNPASPRCFNSSDFNTPGMGGVGGLKKKDTGSLINPGFGPP